MNLFVTLKNNKKVIPLLSLILLLVFISVDIWTTYLASPDLKLEGNFVIRYFNLKWNGLIIYNIAVFVITTIWVVFSIQYILKHLKSTQSMTVLKRTIFCFSCLGIICFYSTLVGACLASISNYFVYLILCSKIDNLFYYAATHYVGFFVKHNITPLVQLIVHNLICIIAGILMTISQINRIKNRFV